MYSILLGLLLPRLAKFIFTLFSTKEQKKGLNLNIKFMADKFQRLRYRSSDQIFNLNCITSTKRVVLTIMLSAILSKK